METKKVATRDGFGEAIVEAGKANPNVLVLDIDIGKSCKTAAFHKELPDQYLNVGIAEQNGAGVAAGSRKDTSRVRRPLARLSKHSNWKTSPNWLSIHTAPTRTPSGRYRFTSQTWWPSKV